MLKNHPIYIAHKNDRVDELLAKFINTYQKRKNLKILFIRESEGTYRFGSKRVYLNVGHGDQVVVRVGGGFMKVEDFIA